MSESEATAGLEVPTIAEGEKVKTINGVKEMEQETEVRLQNGDSDKPQINGDLGKDEISEMEGVSVEQNGDSGGDEEMEEKEGPDIVQEVVAESEDKVEEVVEEDVKAEEKESEGEKEKEEPMEVESKESEKENTDEAKEEVKANTEEESEKKTDETKEDEKTDDTKEDSEKKTEAAKEDVAESTEKKEVEPPPKTPKKKKEKADKDIEEVKEITPTRQLRVRKTPRKYTDDDDDIKITQEVIKDDSSDIEMIEESDPLAISDADIKKVQSKKEVKKDPSVIIIDTNTLLKNQGNLAAAVAQSGGGSSSGVSTVTQTTSGHSNTVSNVNIQTAIQAITGGVPAQGLQSAYITALQQDDAYVIEAPSFIVPYVMEGKPKEPIQKFLKRINKELDEFEKKKKEEEDKKKPEEKEKKKENAEEVVEEKEKEKGDKEDEEDKKEEVKVEDAEEDKGKEAEEEGEKKEGDTEKQEKEGEEKEKEEKMEVDADKDEEEKKEEKEEEEKDGVEKEKDSEKTKTDKDTKEKDGEETDAKEKSKDDENKENKESNKENKKEEDTKEKTPEVDLTDEKKEEDLSFLGKWETYYKSALGKFFLDLGLSQAQEFLQSDLLRMQKKRLDKMKTAPSKEGIMGVRLLEKQLSITKEKNAHLRLPLKICKFCNFKTESEMVMERHLESPHMVNYTYKCNFCDFETRGPQVILFHMEAEHNVRGRLERAPAFFQCSLCPYEDNNKSKMTRHSFSCSKKYKPEKNCEMLDWEPPAKIPKLFPSAFQVHRGRPNTLGKAFEPVRMPHLLPKGMQGMNIIQTGNLQNANLQNANLLNAAGRGRGRPVGSYKTTGTGGSLLYQARGVTTSGNVVGQVGTGGTQQFTLGNQMFHSSGSRVPRILPSSSASSVSLIPGLAASSSITIQSVQSKAGNTKSPQQPSISITPLPRAGQPPQTVTKGATPTRDASGKPSFVICEICDGYIKDLEQLRNHMNLIHKVKIHPKMIYNRPPLNCQKCQHRFFTDQGLERHLLGTHGLVTSSMQEAANKGKDAGRCPICGKVFQWKLLNHVSRDHKMTLKPAHLSYKCTVCTATFNMYRLFENHVYSAHSVVNKNKEGGKQKSGSTESPLKINDEITIIPQPASKTSKASDKSSAGKKADSTPTVSKEITITKVGSRPTRRSGSSVEVISIDESPSKKRSKDIQPQSSNAKRARTSS